MSMYLQIYAVVMAENFHLYRLSKIRRYLTTSTTKILVHSLDISRLDYANSLYAALSGTKLKPLQTVQDAAAYLIIRVTMPTTQALFQLHWLPIQLRIRVQVPSSRLRLPWESCSCLPAERY